MARNHWIALALFASLAACGAHNGSSNEIEAAHIADPVAVPAYVRDALADPARAMHQSTDARRHPAELIAFAGVKAGDHVLDLIPGDGYWTRIFSRIVGPEGRVYAVWPQAYANVAQGNVRTLQALSATPHYANVRVAVQPTGALTAPEPLDLVWTSQNYHDYADAFMDHVGPDMLNRAVFAMLKPGGTWFIVDHRAAPGAGMRDTERLHRIDPAEVRRQVEAAGFEYVGESRILANPEDDHQRTVFDPAIRGHTDQFVMRFRKPAAR
ncbi:MAG: class I SAM-dependent methyltransferase [Sphingomonadaceae bacterium]|nr:class I SAM-dependent methyltransferase [Sphingomonadaceae bacterium]